MNITNPDSRGFSSLSQFANESLADLSISAFNQTATVLTAFDTSGTRTWDLQYYWILAGPLLFTIPLVLLAGSIVKWSVRSAARHAVYWRIAAFSIGPIIYVGLYWAFPYCTVASGYFFFAVVFAGLVAFAIWRIRPRTHPLFWSAFLVVFVGTLFGDIYVRPFIPYELPILSLAPWAVLLWRWIVYDHLF